MEWRKIQIVIRFSKWEGLAEEIRMKETLKRFEVFRVARAKGNWKSQGSSHAID